MKNKYMILIAALVVAGATPLAAQQADDATGTSSDSGEPIKGAVSTQPAVTIQHFRPRDTRGLYMFEAPKDDMVPYTGFKLDWGAAFTQQFQSLDHSNAATAVMKKDAAGKDYNANQLIDIGAGFNNAVANLNLDVQLAPGIRVALTSYLSARHHQEAWVKDGYIQIDASPIDVPALNKLMQYVTLKVGHFEVNYGDAHFRRSDNGNALYNPFVGNLAMDAFTTEIGAEAYLRHGPFLAMLGTTSGESKGTVTTPDDRSMTLTAKIGVDKQINRDVRVRLTASRYATNKSVSNVLYSGDRGGSRYYLVLENMIATATAQAWSGNLNPGFKNEIESYMINPFVKVKNLELFGVIEKSSGKESAETEDREFTQLAVDGVYRLLNERLFVGARYNTVNGRLKGYTDDISVERTQLAAGWFVTPSIVFKGEYVKQNYNDFLATDIRNGAKFDGFVVEGVVAF